MKLNFAQETRWILFRSFHFQYSRRDKWITNYYCYWIRNGFIHLQPPLHAGTMIWWHNSKLKKLFHACDEWRCCCRVKSGGFDIIIIYWTQSQCLYGHQSIDRSTPTFPIMTIVDESVLEIASLTIFNNLINWMWVSN